MAYTFLADRPVEKYRKTDFFFIVSVIILWGLGIFSLYICSPVRAIALQKDPDYFVTRQLLWSLLGFAGLLLFTFIPMEKIRKFLMPAFLVTALLCILTHVPGIGLKLKGAARWINIPGVGSFQPSEMAKFVVILFMANLFDKLKLYEKEDGLDHYKPFIGLMFFAFLIVLQRDLSSSLFLLMVGLTMIFVCCKKTLWLIPVLIALALFTILAIVSVDYRLERFVAFFFPEENSTGSAHQFIKSAQAIIEGGLWGSGSGADLIAAKEVPEVLNDYLFAGWANAMGLLGVTAYFALLIYFGYRGLRIAFSCPDRFAAYGAFGCTIMIFGQSLFNCGVVCGVFPTTGITLPFFSAGGSSLLFTLCMCGFIMNASHCPESEDFEDDDETLEVEEIETFR